MDIEKLKALALAAGSEQWNDDADDSAVVCDESGYAVCVCEANLGGMSTIFADQIAEFIAAANPAAVLELIAEVERLREACPGQESVAHIVAQAQANAVRGFAQSIVECDIVSPTVSTIFLDCAEKCAEAIKERAAIEKEKA